MTYSLYKPTGSNGTNPISVPDNAIDTSYYDSTNKLGLQLIGRNAIDYGTAVAQNTIQMTSNFAGSVVPKPTIALQGQLWFNSTSNTDGVLYVRKTSSTASQPNQAADISANWEKVVTVDGSETGTIPIVNPSGTPKDGDIQVLTSPTRINIYGGGVWNQIFPAIYA